MARQFTRAPICVSECCANDGRIKCGPCLRHNADLQGISCIECWDKGVIEWKDEYCTCAKGAAQGKRGAVMAIPRTKEARQAAYRALKEALREGELTIPRGFDGVAMKPIVLEPKQRPKPEQARYAFNEEILYGGARGGGKQFVSMRDQVMQNLTQRLVMEGKRIETKYGFRLRDDEPSEVVSHRIRMAYGSEALRAAAHEMTQIEIQLRDSMTKPLVDYVTMALPAPIVVTREQLHGLRHGLVKACDCPGCAPRVKHYGGPAGGSMASAIAFSNPSRANREAHGRSYVGGPMTSPLEPVETEDTLSDTERKAVEKIVEREIREAHAPSLFTQIANTVAVLFFLAALGLVGWLVYEGLRAGGLV